jgi:NAD-dependent protein deacetylase/lipoamidase
MPDQIPDHSDADLTRAAELLRAAGRVAILTGAGVSAESGVPTFRDADGLWEGHHVEDVATPRAFARDPTLVWRFYNLRRENLRQVEPNRGHFALAGLERRLGSANCAVITQNVDGLHRRAGSTNVFELHGNIARTRCTGCSRVDDRGLDPLGDLPLCPHCTAPLRPDIVWFTEALPVDVWHLARRAVDECHCLLVVGTSALVYPAAGLIQRAKAVRGRVIEINVTRTAASHLADVSLIGKSGEILPRLIDGLGDAHARPHS